MSDTLLAALVPVECYAIAYSYESGYCTRFRIPVEFIAVSGGHILRACGSMVVVAFFLYSMGSILFSQYKPYNTPIKRHVFASIPVALICLGFWFIYRSHIQEYWFVVAFSVFIWILPVVLAVIRFRRVPGLAAKVTAQIESEDRVETGADRLLKTFGYDAPMVGFVALLLVVFSFARGHAEAMDQKDFLVVQREKPLVVLRVYSESIICGEFDRARKKLGPTLKVLSYKDGDSPLSWDDCGPLTPPNKP